VEDLEAWEKQAGVRVSAGDALFVRTGVWARRKAVGPWLRGRAEGGRSAGLDPSVIPWLKERDIAILASDHPQYVSPSNLRGAVHDFALLYLGVHLFDNCDLEALADAAAERRRWDFLLTAAPLPIRGGTGSPANPIATF
jgi:kynurenine formamidase